MNPDENEERARRVESFHERDENPRPVRYWEPKEKRPCGPGRVGCSLRELVRRSRERKQP